MDRITPEQKDAIIEQLRIHHLLGTGKATISELNKRQQDNFYVDYGKFVMIIEDVNRLIQC